MSGVSADDIRQKLTEKLEPTHLEVVDESDGCGLKFKVVVVSSKFENLMLIKRHRLVHEAIGEDFQAIHAFSQNTYTPKQWEERLKSESGDK